MEEETPETKLHKDYFYGKKNAKISLTKIIIKHKFKTLSTFTIIVIEHVYSDITRKSIFFLPYKKEISNIL